MVWRHLVLGTWCSWLHGDPRGFRSRDHNIHSSGDYKAPPPAGEHAGLFKYQDARSGETVGLDIDLRIVVCREFILKMQSLDCRIIATSVGERHLHGLAELMSEYSQMIKTVGKCKQKASHAIRQHKPGRIWAEGGSYKRIKDADHLNNTYGYVRTRQDPGTIVWSHNPEEDWITNPSVGVVMMVERKKQIRIFPQAGV